MNIADADLITERPHLLSVAYRMLGSAAEAEDAVQEAMLNLARATDAEPPRSPRAYMTTVVTRVCLDRLKSAQVRRESYVGPWLPEPVRTDREDAFSGPVHPRDTHALSIAFLVVLETLSPLERAAFLLHEVFDYTHAEIAEMLGRDPAAVRQLVHRARAHVSDGRPRFAPDRAAHERMLMSFLTAVTSGDLEALTQVLASDAVLRSDSGGKAKAARKTVHGALNVARFFVGVYKKTGVAGVPEIAEVNGWPALLIRDGDRVLSVTAIETDGAQIFSVHSMVNPDKLTRVA